MMMKRGHLKYSFPGAESFPGEFKIAYLQHYRQCFCKKKSTKNANKDLFPDHDGKYRNDTSESQASCITHKNLCRIRIIPEKTNAGPDKSAYIDYQFTGIWDIHYIQVIGKNDVT